MRANQQRKQQNMKNMAVFGLVLAVGVMVMPWPVQARCLQQMQIHQYIQIASAPLGTGPRPKGMDALLPAQVGYPQQMRAYLYDQKVTAPLGPRPYPDGIGLYMYVRSAPVNHTDPSGLFEVKSITVNFYYGKGLADKVNSRGEKDPDLGHAWIEIGPEKESYGWYPDRVIDGPDAIKGTLGDLNGQKAFGGTPTTDPHHGGKVDDSYHPLTLENDYFFNIILISVPKMKMGSKKGTSCECVSEDDIKDCIRSFAADRVAKKQTWSLLGYNCYDFVYDASDTCCLHKQGHTKKHIEN